MFHRKRCTSFDDFLKKAHLLQPDYGWIFRGQKNAKDPLETKLERDCKRFGVKGDDRREVERQMVREFQRRLHHYTNNVPKKDSEDEWMALMRHHGAPTRLLDFTYSPYVAAYFALEEADSDSTAAVWAVDTNWCASQLKLRFDKTLVERYRKYQKERGPRDFESIFMSKPPHKLVLPVNPFRLNERLAYQRGVFLCPGDVTIGFMENLSDFAGKQNPDGKVIKFTIPTGLEGENRDEALRLLDQMNINRITLFPGLDGFAQSFSARIRIHFLERMHW
jgi:hypothetical protein